MPTHQSQKQKKHYKLLNRFGLFFLIISILIYIENIISFNDY